MQFASRDWYSVWLMVLVLLSQVKFWGILAVRGKMTSTATCTPSCKEWPRFLVEFRGTQPNLRLDEFIDVSAAVLGVQMAERIRASIDIVIPDPISCQHDPICAYFNLPEQDVLISIVQRCAMVRSAMEVFGDADTLEGANKQAVQSRDIQRHFTRGNNVSRKQNSWRVNFKRFGRGGHSGLSPSEKKEVLEKFGVLLREIDGDVNLAHAEKELVVMEDWHCFHQDVIINQEYYRNNHSKINLDNQFTSPRRCIFGIKLQEGPQIYSKFEVRNRP